MTEEKDFWINKAEVYALSNAEGTAYKVKQEMMNKLRKMKSTRCKKIHEPKGLISTC